MASLTQVVDLLQQTLKPWLYQDYCPNGLQVGGREEVRRIVTGVTACQALIDEAIRLEADAILVHHGYFWKGENPCLTGIKRERIRTLLAHDMSLLAYHLPLDGHPELGNNARLADKLGLPLTGLLYPDNPKQVGNISEPQSCLSANALRERIASVLGREPLHIAAGPSEIKRIGLCSGGAQGFIEQAVLMGCDAYISGEISEQTVHVAREAGLHYFAAGHHATERYGVQALGQWLSEQLGIEHRFVEIDNPV